jgi:hypothetical protein
MCAHILASFSAYNSWYLSHIIPTLGSFSLLVGRACFYQNTTNILCHEAHGHGTYTHTAKLYYRHNGKEMSLHFHSYSPVRHTYCPQELSKYL